jgi:hypothetical protein
MSAIARIFHVMSCMRRTPQIPSFPACAYGTADDQNELWVDNYTVHTTLKHRTGCCEQTIL